MASGRLPFLWMSDKDERLPESPKSITEIEETFDRLSDLRKKFVGEVNLPEGTSYYNPFRVSSKAQSRGRAFAQGV